MGKQTIGEMMKIIRNMKKEGDEMEPTFIPAKECDILFNPNSKYDDIYGRLYIYGDESFCNYRDCARHSNDFDYLFCFFMKNASWNNDSTYVIYYRDLEFVSEDKIIFKNGYTLIRCFDKDLYFEYGFKKREEYDNGIRV